jgi:hypothetical protein
MMRTSALSLDHSRLSEPQNFRQGHCLPMAVGAPAVDQPLGADAAAVILLRAHLRKLFQFLGANLYRYCLLLAWRVVIQRSRPPKLPVRLDEKKSVRASWDNSGCRSANAVFNGGPAFSGADQG